MGETPTFKSEAVDWADIGYQLAHGIAKRLVESEPRKLIVGTLAEKEAVVAGMVFDALVELASTAGSMLHKIEGPFLPVIASFVAPIIGGLFGAEIGEAAFARRMASGDGATAGQAIVNGLMEAIAGNAAGTPTPGDEGARRIAGAAVAASLESTFNAMVPELVSDLFPGDFLHFDAFTELPENIIRTLGVSRLVRRALGPLVTATCTTPLQWHVNKKYPSALLSPASAARQIARGFGTKETWLEDLRRQGYDQARIDAVLNEQRHYFSAADVRTFVNREYWDSGKGLAHLRDQGYDEQAATDAMRLEGLRRIDELETQEANAITGAYVSGDIDRGTFLSMLGASVTVATERALLTELADVRRAANVKHLTPAQVASMVKDDILAFVDYRDALAREGYEDFAITALDLQLRKQIDDKKTIDQHRADQAAEKASAAKARADAAAAKKAALEAQRALQRRGKRVDLERAAVRGLISLDRVAEIYAAEYDDDTAGILMGLLEQDRQTYIDQQAARDKAKAAGKVRGVDVGALDEAVTRGILTIGEYTDRLRQLGYTADDAGLLAATLQAKIDDTAAAKDVRDQAIAAGKVKHVSVQTIETLVRRGHRTLADYDQTLQTLGFDDGARAAMADLLQDQIDRDRKADAERAAAAAKRDARGLSLEQMRRAVVIGVSTLDEFQTYLVAQNYTADAQIVLVDELRTDVTEADAARQRRADADAAKDSRDAPIADVARAARLGLISVAAYTDRLSRAGYDADAVDLETDLLVQEMADLADARQRRDQANADAQSKNLPLAQIERAVRSGIATIPEYTAAARSAGFSAEAADVLSRLLQTELDAAAAAQARHDAIAAAAAVRDLSLAQLEASVKAGLLTLDDYRERIAALGYGADDVELLATLLGRQLAVLDTARARRAAIAGGPPEPEVALSTLEKAVKAGVLTMDAFVRELVSRGYGAGAGLAVDADGRVVLAAGNDGPFDDTALLALLLQVDLDAKAAKGAP